ncbi:MAG: hypothetical protein A2018_03995 [Alphaproteobacteria bacterium GWF2_58_20]|nr:MAG: hypothetical protein A2018_03995 [Alphaproteobacteria bacterium GWF2_58_20]
MPEYVDVMAFIPEVFLAVMVPVFLFLGLWKKQDSYNHLAWLAMGIAFIVIILLFSGERQTDIDTRFAILACMATMAALVLLPGDAGQEDMPRPEYPGLVLCSLLGSLFMLRTHHGLFLVMGSLLAGLPLTTLALLHQGNGSRKKAFQVSSTLYVAMGMASACLAFGFMFLYVACGTLSYQTLGGFAMPTAAMLLGASFVVCGLLVFCGIVFFHAWVVVAMQSGAASLSLLSALLLPLSSFGVLFSLFHGPLAWALPVFAMPLRFMGGLSVLLAGAGVLMGRQARIYKLLSGAIIAQGGIGLVALVSMKAWAVALHGTIYLLAMAGMGGLLLALRRNGDRLDEMTDIHAFADQNPLLAVILLVFAGSLSFLPPFPGFVAFYAVMDAVPEMPVRILLVAGAFLFAVGQMRAFSGVFAGVDDKEHAMAGQFSLSVPIRLMTLVCIAGLLGFLFLPHALMSP